MLLKSIEFNATLDTLVLCALGIPQDMPHRSRQKLCALQHVKDRRETARHNRMKHLLLVKESARRWVPKYPATESQPSLIYECSRSTCLNRLLIYL